jgi:hypothetical protein
VQGDNIQVTVHSHKGLGFEAAEQLANAVLYEGYILYPYRSSATKNRKRWSFGTLYPESCEEVSRGLEQCRQQTQCLLVAAGSSRLHVRVRFLQWIDRRVEKSLPGATPIYHAVKSLNIEGRRYETWEESVERSVDMVLSLEQAVPAPLRVPFSYPYNVAEELLYGSTGKLRGRILRVQQSIDGVLNISIEFLEEHLFKLTVETVNTSGIMREEGSIAPNHRLQSFVSTHSMMNVNPGEFVSLLDPPQDLRRHASACTNVGSFPVLVGDPARRQLLLSSPIILYDYAFVAPESHGDFFDATEIDELLTLRIRTLTDEEKTQMRSADDNTRKLLDRSEAATGDQLMNLHGKLRGFGHMKEVE